MEKKDKKRKPAGAWSWAVLLLIALSTLRSVGNSRVYAATVTVVVVLAVLLVVVGMLRKARAASGTDPARPAAPQRRSVGPELRTVSRRAEAPAQTTLWDTGESSDTERDIQRRRAQLDAFLKNGIVDKREYDFLRSRHEQRR